MAVRVRLTRVGSKKNPIWRVVVADQRSPRDGRFIETIGHYNPQTDPSTIVINTERMEHWVSRGAQPSNTVKHLLRAQSKSAAAAAAEPADADPTAAVGPATEDGPAVDEPAEAEPAEPQAAEGEPGPNAEPAAAEPTEAEPRP